MMGKTIKVPWNEDGTRTSVQKFEVSPMGDIIAFHGRFGNIHIYSDRTRSKIFTLKMNDDITSCSFSSDGELLYSQVPSLDAWDDIRSMPFYDESYWKVMARSKFTLAPA